MHTYFATLQIFPDHIVEERVSTTFTNTQEALRIIEGRLRQYEHQDSDVDANTEIYQNLKTYLEQIDREKSVILIPIPSQSITIHIRVAASSRAS